MFAYRYVEFDLKKNSVTNYFSIASSHIELCMGNGCSSVTLRVAS